MQIQPKQENVPQGTPETPLIVKIRPGISSGRSVKGILPSEQKNATIENVIQYILRDSTQRSDTRLGERVKSEMANEYTLTVNSDVVQGQGKASEYFVDKKSPSGLDYKELEIVVAAKQEGGLANYLR